MAIVLETTVIPRGSDQGWGPTQARYSLQGCDFEPKTHSSCKDWEPILLYHRLKGVRFLFSFSLCLKETPLEAKRGQLLYSLLLNSAMESWRQLWHPNLLQQLLRILQAKEPHPSQDSGRETLRGEQTALNRAPVSPPDKWKANLTAKSFQVIHQPVFKQPHRQGHGMLHLKRDILEWWTCSQL